MIETTLLQLVEAEKALERIGQRPFPPAVGYAMAKLRAAVKAETVHFYEMRETLMRQHGDVRPANLDERPTLGSTVLTVRPDELEAYTLAVRELAQIRVSLDVTPLTLAMLGTDPMTPNDLWCLGPLLTDELAVTVRPPTIVVP